MITAAVTGFFTSISLILAIGAQNALVLRHGLARSHVFWICLFCATSDAILIALGVFGFGRLVTAYPSFTLYLAVFGVLFLGVYGLLRLWAAFKGDYAIELTGKPQTLRSALITVAAFTWLNPHVYLDTVALLGAVSAKFESTGEKVVFGIAAIAASYTFFFSLGYGARLLAPYMTSARVWRMLDIAIALVMFVIAYSLAVAFIL